MRSRALIALALGLTVLAPGCITFYGDQGVRVQVLVTEEMGTHVLTNANVTVPAGASVLDALREVGTVETAYGGGFVEAIDGHASRYPDERVDWFYHLDTRLADEGAASVPVEDGQLVVWDRRPWNRTMTLEHVLTGLEAWPGNLTQGPVETTPDAWEDNASTPHRAEQLFARTDDGTLVLLDPWGRAAERLTAPWLIVHAVDGPGPTPGLVVLASGSDGLALAETLDERRPRGLGVALTPNATYTIPTTAEGTAA